MQAHHESEERSGGHRVEVTRGVIVIVLAVAVGAFVVTQGLKNDDSESVAAATDIASVSGAADDQAANDQTANDTTGDSGEGQGAEGSSEIGGATAEAGDQDGPDAGADAGAVDPGDAADATDPSATETDPAGPGTQAAADVTVLVLNGAGAKGIAGRGSAILQEAGYDVLAPRNANFLGPSKIFYTEGFEDEAIAVAGVYSVDPAAVVAPLDPANPPINDTRQANIVVVVGEDGLIQV